MISDLLALLGTAMIGVGIGLTFGLGPALAVTGLLLVVSVLLWQKGKQSQPDKESGP